MTRIILVAVAAFCWHTASSQVVTITDAESGRPLEYVVLYSEHPNITTTTDKEGKARTDLFSDAETIRIRMLGYAPLDFSYQELASATIIGLSPENLSLEQVVISATRWNTASDRIPEKVSTLNPRNVALWNPQTAADMLGTGGEVFVQKSQQGGGSPMIRGFSANRLLYSIDGVRMNTAIFRSGNLQNVISLDPLVLERTEVAFGPGTVMYGSDAVGAVMSFQTFQPRLSTNETTTTGGTAFIRYASANFEKTAHVLAEISGEKWASLTSLTFTDYDDLVMGKHGPDEFLRPWYAKREEGTDVKVTNSRPRKQVPSGYAQWNLTQKLRYKPNERLDLTYGLHLSTTTDYDRYDRLILERDGQPRYGAWYYGPQQWMMNVLTLEHNAPNRLFDQAVYRIAYQFFGESRNNRSFGESELQQRKEAVNAVSANADFRKTLTASAFLTYGVEWVYNHVDSRGTGVAIETGGTRQISARYPVSTWNSIAAYAQYSRKISGTTDFQAGLRYNVFLLNADFSNNEAFFPLPETSARLSNGGLAANVGIVHRTERKGELRVLLSTGFRAPNVDDIGKVFDSEPGAVVVPNPGLAPEYAYNAEAGYGRQVADFLRADLTAYFTWLDNAMVRRDYTFNGTDSIFYDGTLSQVQAVQNASQAVVYGIQFGMEAQLPADIVLTARVNWQKGTDQLEDGSSSPARHAAPVFGLADFTRSYQNWQFSAYVMFSGSLSYENLPEEERGKPHLYATDAQGRPFAKGWYTLNFKSSYQVSDHVLVTFGLENVTNQRYRTYSSGIAAAGVNAIVSARVSF